MATIKLYIKVNELSNVLSLYDRIKVYRASSVSGTYSEITTAATRIPLQQGVETYLFDDTGGSATSWYKTSYFNSATLAESSQSDPSKGETFDINSLILSVEQLKTVYLYGLDLTDDNGTPYPDVIFEWSINFAIDWLEKELDLSVRPTTYTDERYDYWLREYESWAFIKLKHSPVISVSSVKLMWPSDTTVLEFDPSWIQLQPEDGQINIIPTAGTLGQVLLVQGGGFLPLLSAGRDFLPNAFAVTYTAGFPEGECPMDIRELIGKKAAFGPLNIAGDLLGGAGIASQSIGIDGLSQSFNTTSSATNSGFGARLLQYKGEIKEQLETLKRYYKGIRLTAI
jgi:hypothetical protein